MSTAGGELRVFIQSLVYAQDAGRELRQELADAKIGSDLTYALFVEVDIERRRMLMRGLKVKDHSIRDESGTMLKESSPEPK